MSVMIEDKTKTNMNRISGKPESTCVTCKLIFTYMMPIMLGLFLQFILALGVQVTRHIFSFELSGSDMPDIYIM